MPAGGLEGSYTDRQTDSEVARKRSSVHMAGKRLSRSLPVTDLAAINQINSWLDFAD